MDKQQFAQEIFLAFVSNGDVAIRPGTDPDGNTITPDMVQRGVADVITASIAIAEDHEAILKARESAGPRGAKPKVKVQKPAEQPSS